MPKILTAETKDAVFFLPYSQDKSEGVWCKPITLTVRNEARREAQREAGMDPDLTEAYLCRILLKRSIIDWKGFWTPLGEDIQCTPKAIEDMCEYDPLMAAGMLSRIMGIARIGALDERKN